MPSKTVALFVATLLAASVVPASALPADGQSADAYGGSHVAFDVQSAGVVDYAVDGETMVESMAVQSKDDARVVGGIGLDVALSAVTALDASGFSMGATTETSATVETGGSATVTAHDSGHGVVVVSAGGESQYVVANVSQDATAEAESDSRVTVTSENGTTGTFIVVGEGSVTVNEEDNVSAELGEDARLVFRAYPDGRSDNEERQEEMIADGRAAAEVYVRESADASGEFVAGVAEYGQNTTVEVTQKSQGTVEMTAERSESEGTVVITSVSEAVVGSAEDVRVTVDGEAAVEASSYSELRSAIGGDSSKFMVAQQSSAEASADVLVAVNHFSTRTVTVSDGSTSDGGGDTTTTGDGTTTAGDDGTTTDTTAGGGDDTTTGGSDDGTTADGDTATTTDGGDAPSTESGGVPGFTVGVALAALAVAGLLARRR